MGLWLLCLPAFAAVISGTLAQDTQWRAADGPFQLRGEVRIPAGVKLEIEAGSVILMEAGASLLVNGGQVKALGSADALIQVKSVRDAEGQAGDWRHWLFSNGAQAQLQHVQFRHGEGLQLQASSLQIDFIEILDMAGAALEQDLASSSYGAGNRAERNRSNAILLPAGEIHTQARWGVQGIPYLLASGEISVGAAPLAGSLHPASLVAGETIQSVLRGSRLQGLGALQFGPGVSARLLEQRSDTEALLEITADADSSGVFTLQAQTDAGAIRLAAALHVARIQPLLTGVQPGVAYLEQGVQNLQIEGRNFQAGSVLMLDGQALLTSVESGVLARAELPTPTQAGKRKLSLRTPDLQNPGQFLDSNQLDFTVLVPRIAPELEQARIPAGMPQTLLLRLPFRAPADGLRFSVQSSAPQVLRVAESVTFAAGEQEKSITLDGLTPGDAILRLSRNAWTELAVPVKVTLPPYQLAYGPAISPVLGVKVGDDTAVVRQIGPVRSASVGVLIGPAIEQVSKQALSVGAEAELVLSGQGLQAMQTLQLQPAEGLTLGALQISPDGKQARLRVQVAASAQRGLRRWQALDAAGQPVLFVRAQDEMLLIADGSPVLESVAPQVLERGKSARLILRGRHFSPSAQVSILPAQGVHVAGGQVSPDGQEIVLDVQVAHDAAEGERVAVVTSAEGDSGASPQPGNRFQITAGAVRIYSGIGSSVLGVQVGADIPAPKMYTAHANLGVVVGSAALSMAPAGMLKSSSGELLLQGVALQAWNGQAASLFPAADSGVTFGPAQVDSAGMQVRIPYQISNQAVDGSYALRLNNNAGQPLLFTAQAERILRVYAAPQIASLNPLTLQSGRIQTLELRGANLRYVQSLRFEDANGVEMPGIRLLDEPRWQDDAQGGKLVVSLQLQSGISGNGVRVRLLHPAGVDTQPANSANTITILNP
ncbi:hypothetical protein V8J88_01880 [Massilia sp. W12]|uniref:hypothetical protein n=1 Tax=Massilia sp. W12 TaxID=3126507 RepID=UPI0030CDC81C